MEPAPERPQETPALTEAAAQLLSLIGPEELERCLFAETLEVVAAGGQRGDQAGGQWWAAARRAPYERAGEPVRTCLLVQAGSRSRQDGVPCSSTLKAYVTPQLETLEQEEQERLELRAHPTERRTHMVSHQHGMIVTKTLQEGEVRLSEGSLPSARWGRGHSCPVPPRGAAGSGGCHPQGRWGCGCPCGRVSPQAEPQSWSFSYSRAGLQGLLLEGASLLLLRVLARQRAVPPSLIFPAIDTEGHLCTSSYRALGIQQQAVGSAEVEVFVIERAVHTSTSISTVWHSSFLPSGRLAQRVQVGCSTLVLLQDESVLGKTGGVEPQPPFPKQSLDWEEDIQLYSWFLDRKEELQVSHAAYVQQHPELWALLADFLQALLLQQPCDPVSFAAQFFAPFARQQPTGTPFTSAGAAIPLPSPSPHHPLANGE
ncbi:ciliogenesis-associated TTC17-interacting protein isoform X3 [Phalacrocorax carbo]|uniref:ciliogenesis-associated TTC17-interacting protein isoform X3 n=1 Tax=Phalacrocorax carbo TaxID=9209 RepID=UPI003119DD99